ncbi:DOMON-like domain-containing protein [Altericista sp. CCNU0014]|uniref:DOMON-like domain-containing protein n=1 Tax=Altericista sp. CCNU0014 TaxID=3082949 RepID=UPI00384B29E7
MNDQIFSLQPFGKDPTLPNLEVIGTIARRDPFLLVQYTLLGEIDRVIVPAPNNKPTRKTELWEQTCFEFFLSIRNSPAYWEFNLSPTGDWNIYRFEDYRQGMQEETAYTELPFSTETEADAFSLSLRLDLDEIIPVGRVLDVGISAVTELEGGKITHWALKHPSTQADFHRRESFTLKL